MRVPRGLQERALDVERAIADLTQQLGRSPTPGDLAKHTGMTTEEVLEALEAASNHVVESLDTRLAAEADSPTRLEALGTIDPHYDFVEEVEALAPALRELPARERKILELRFGQELPQSEIARRLGISQMHVSRLLRRTLDELREKVEVTAPEVIPAVLEDMEQVSSYHDTVEVRVAG
jgi:RNA polymerase sigma-B factor